VLPLVLLVVAGLAAMAFPSVRCQLFGISCEQPEPIIDPNEDTLKLAIACSAPKLTAAPCAVKACFSEYLARVPSDKVATSARSILDEANDLCLKAQKKEIDERAARLSKAAEEAAFKSAQQCAKGATDCVVKNCYAGYLTKYGKSGARRDEANAAVAAAEEACHKPADKPADPAVAISDGLYNANTHRACGAAAQYGIHIAVKSGSVSWEHELRGTRYTWTGTMDQRGNIRASVGNSGSYVATGRYSDSQDAPQEVQMNYPQCGSEPIVLTIIGKL
jgi:hypothetical protein